MVVMHKNLYFILFSIVFLIFDQKSYAQDKQTKNEHTEDIIVTGKNYKDKLRGGLWLVRLTPSYYIGPRFIIVNSETFEVDHSITSPIGKDEQWNICLWDNNLTDLIKLLIGEGQTKASGTTNCSKVIVNIKDNSLSARQTCSGGRMQIPGNKKMVNSQSENSVTGKYNSEQFKIVFRDSQTPVGYDPSYYAIKYDREWSITGLRKKDCAVQ